MSSADTDVLGLEGTFPRPGWVVLDEVRERRFTGEVVCATEPAAVVYADRGEVYHAERLSDPALGLRLVDAGALTAVQLDAGVLHIAGVDHLGRLFERVPAVDRHAVLVTAELLTEECIGWIASQRVHGVEVAPYRHHPAGLHHWFREQAPVGDVPPMPGPAATGLLPPPPPPPAVPRTPERDQVAAPAAREPDDVIRWNEPSWLDAPAAPSTVAEQTTDIESAAAGESFEPAEPIEPDGASGAPVELQPIEEGDWIDRLDEDGLPEPGSDPFARPAQLPQLPPEPIDRFEVIWPSGEVDEQFGGDLGDLPHPDIDRAGPTVRLTRGDRDQAPVATSITASPGADASIDELDEFEAWLAADADEDGVTDDVVLAVRRAVAEIENGGLLARPPQLLPQAPIGDQPTRRMRATTPTSAAGGAARSAMTAPNAASVFDVAPGGAPVAVNAPVVAPAVPDEYTTDEYDADEYDEYDADEYDDDEYDDEDDESSHRTGALRRLINNLRRR